jgi:cytochrome c-type biogenesis protein CcmF
MVIHPVMLYLGFIGMTVPFSFAVAALVTGQLGNTWIKLIRRWTLIPWLCLSVGIILGSQWAYVELGWGGYWAWDPVEVASWLPWLTATAFIHSIMIQERRGMLKVWNVALIWLTWELTLVGTFLTRSGVVDSVHSFALSPIGPMFAVFIIATLIGFAAILVWRLPLLRSDNELDALLSRETAFLTQNVLFVVIMLASLMGVLFGPLSEILTGNKIALNAPYFERVDGPLLLALLVVMGAAPLLAWRRSAPETLAHNFAIPISAGILMLPALYLLGNRVRAGFVGFSLLAFVLAGIIQEYVRGVRARRRNTGESVPAALAGLLRRNGHRYGGYLVHVGVIMIALAIIGNRFYQSQGQGNLQVGQSLNVADYTLTYTGLQPENGPNYVAYTAALELARDGRPAGMVYPKEIVYDKNQDQPMTAVGLRTGPVEDLYVVLAGFDGTGGSASFKVFVNPLMAWMWAGGLVIILGVLATAWPQRAARRVEVRARVAGGAPGEAS